MVSKKRLYYGGLDGFRAPIVPKAPRSIRRISHKKSTASSEICPFELLAAVAGQLLLESESSASTTGSYRKQINIREDGVKQEQLEVKLKPLRLDYLDQGCSAESEFVPEPPNLELKLEPPSKDLPQSDNDSGLEHASIVTTSDIVKKDSANVKLEAANNGTFSKSVGGSPSHGDLCDVDMEDNRASLQTDAVEKLSEDLTTVKSCVNHRVLNKSYNNVHVPFYSDPVPSVCFPKHRKNVKIGIRDDDENSFSYNHHSTKMRAYRLQSRAGYRKIRKMVSGKYWKSAPKLKDYEHFNSTSRGGKPFDHNRKNILKRERYQAETASKRRKQFHHSSKSDYVQETSSESISNIPERSASGDKRRSSNASNRVKFSIKSFKVPELYVEMPETSTVGSLKRTVMEAVAAILGSELHIGVLLQGKKIRDDNITLEQTGISLNSDSLGFMLEPNVPEASQSLAKKEPPLLLPCDRVQPLPSSPATPDVDMGFFNSSAVDPTLGTNSDNQVVNNQETKTLLTEVSAEEIVEDTKAIVPVTPLNPEAISVVPLNHNLSKRSELSQRRTRRPFSVYEVEALVEAVETLGTGRWRDVKFRAFDDANHRTYVDLKDKWKTLVHTASISPQQRRGEPVPQDLLDRVLAAHSFWTQNQSKQQGKHQTELLQPPPVKVCLEFER